MKKFIICCLILTISCDMGLSLDGDEIGNVSVSSVPTPTTFEPTNTTHSPLTTTSAPNTTTTGTTTTTTPIPNTTVTTSTSTTPITPTTKLTTPSAPPTTTSAPAPKDRRFDGPSFIGGIILASGLMAIAFISFKFYKARTERNYHTL